MLLHLQLISATEVGTVAFETAASAETWPVAAAASSWPCLDPK